MDKFSDFTKEEILSSPRLLYNRKGLYSQILLFPNNLMPNENFRDFIAVGHTGNIKNKFEIIGEIPGIKVLGIANLDVNCSSVGAIIIQDLYGKLLVYGRSKDDPRHLDIFEEKE